MKAMKVLGNNKLETAALQTRESEIATANGFASAAEFEDVANNIALVMGLEDVDLKEGSEVDKAKELQKELQDVQNNAAIPVDEKQLVVGELTDEVKAAA